jgi:hypothetical protein
MSETSWRQHGITRPGEKSLAIDHHLGAALDNKHRLLGVGMPVIRDGDAGFHSRLGDGEHLGPARPVRKSAAGHTGQQFNNFLIGHSVH